MGSTVRCPSKLGVKKMETSAIHVSEVLSQTSARLWRKGTAACGLAFAEWEWRDAEGWANYDQPDHHTLSVYLDGGDKIVRADRQLLGGGPDKFCLMPAGHASRWHVGGPIRMFHLYIDPAVLAYQAHAAFDITPRRIDLQDLTFVDDPALAMIVRGAVLPLDWSDLADRMALESACHLLLHRLLRHHTNRATTEVIKGRLAPAVQRNIIEYIEANLSSALKLEELACRAKLSTFHFAKMFRASVGLPPHAYVAKRRVDRAKSLLHDGKLELAQIALACGYASQSHFTRAFKGEAGMTPGAWRRVQEVRLRGLGD
ncbi:HTH-type transcriptional activator RhaR [compost metagenome]